MPNFSEVLAPPRAEENRFTLGFSLGLLGNRGSHVHSSSRPKHCGAGDLSSKPSKPLWQNTGQEMVVVKRTSGNGVRAFLSLLVTKPGTATFAETVEVNSHPHFALPIEAALLVKGSMGRGLPHQSPRELWLQSVCDTMALFTNSVTSSHSPSRWRVAKNSLKAPKQRSDVSQIGFEDLSYIRDVIPPPPRIWKGKVWLSFAELFPQVS